MPNDIDPQRRAFGPAGLRRRSELMDAAVRLAARNGLDGMRVSDIVGRVGVGQGVFYWYFESKEALYGEIVADLRRRLRHYQGAFIAGEADPVRRIAKGIVGTVDFVAHNRHVYAFLDHAVRRGFRSERDAGRVHVLDVARHLREAMALGTIRRRDPELLAQAVSAVVERLGWVHLSTRGRVGVDEVATEAIDFVLGGLLGTPSMEVGRLRSDVAPTPELLDVRDRVGALAPDTRAADGGDRPALRSANGSGRSHLPRGRRAARAAAPTVRTDLSDVDGSRADAAFGDGGATR